MTAIRFAGVLAVMAVICATDIAARSQEGSGDAAAITSFQRSVDAYAFQHRQVQRRLGETVDQKAMAAGMHTARPAAAEGDLFTPIVAAAFRSLIVRALRAPGCEIADDRRFEVPRAGAVATGTHALSSCVSGVLPRLPEELEYRTASTALVLVDTHANIVVDVVHAAFPPPELR